MGVVFDDELVLDTGALVRSLNGALPGNAGSIIQDLLVLGRSEDIETNVACVLVLRERDTDRVIHHPVVFSEAWLREMEGAGE